MADLSPFPDYYIIRQAFAGAQTQGGIVLPDASREALGYGAILAKGSATPDKPSVGDIVYFQEGMADKLLPIGDDGAPTGDEVAIMHHKDCQAWQAIGDEAVREQMMNPVGVVTGPEERIRQRRKVGM